jgi:hypothetical protein
MIGISTLPAYHSPYIYWHTQQYENQRKDVHVKNNRKVTRCIVIELFQVGLYSILYCRIIHCWIIQLKEFFQLTTDFWPCRGKYFTCQVAHPSMKSLLEPLRERTRETEVNYLLNPLYIITSFFFVFVTACSRLKKKKNKDSDL